MNRNIKIVNKKNSGEVLEARFLRKTNGKLVKLGGGIGQPIYPGETMTVELPSYEAMQLRKVKASSGRATAWSIAMPASSTKSLPKKKQKKAVGASRTAHIKSGKKKSKVTVKPPKKKAKKKKKKASKKAAKKKKKGGNLPKTVMCKICGQRIKREKFFKHRWTKHRKAAMASNRKAQKTRSKKAKGKKKAS